MTTQDLTKHQQVYLRLRAMILHGELAPGQAVTINGLADKLNAGMTPIREAIRRLTAEGALEFQGNRRVQVPKMTLQKLDQLLYARLALEPHLAELAVEFVNQADIDGLEKYDDELDAAIASGDVQSYMRLNHLFHSQLYLLSGAQTLVQIVDGLWLQAGPSLRAMCGLFGTQNLPDMHVAAIEALRDKNSQGVARAIDADVRQGMGNVRKLISRDIV